MLGTLLSWLARYLGWTPEPLTHDTAAEPESTHLTADEARLLAETDAEAQT